MTATEVAVRGKAILSRIEQVIVGKHEPLALILGAILAGGHVLIEDYPGLAKTLAARCFSWTLGLTFKRIQFTPDLLPADIVGTHLFRRDEGRFEFRPGPIFTQFILADEINRATPKTQSALLEAMQEGQATVEGDTRPLPQPFVVLATQNPIEHEGTFPLPEAQVDRFLVRVRFGYPQAEEEEEILRRRIERQTEEVSLPAVTDAAEIVLMRQALEEIFVDPDLRRYMVQIVGMTRRHASLAVGASPRGTLALLKLARARAALAGRDFVLPDDVKSVAVPALAHRLILSPELWTRDVRAEDIVAEILAQTPGAQGGVMGTHKARTEFVLLILLLTLGVGLRQPALAFLALPVAVHLLGGFAFATRDRRPRLAAERTLSASRLWEGETVEVVIEVENKGRRVELVHVQDPPPPGIEVVDGQAETVAELAAGGRVVLRYVARARRGLYPFPTVRVEAQDLLGYVTWHADLPCPAPLAVLPRFERLSGIAIAPRRTLPQAGTARSRRGGSGIEFFGAREYRPGDEIRRINWKAAARVGELVVTEFEEERAADVAVVLDVRDRAYRSGDPALLDHAVRGAAGLCQAFLSQGHRVGLLMYGAYLDWVYPGYGRRHGERLLRELARATPGRSEVFAELRRLPTRLLRPGSQVALVSPLLPGDEEDLGVLTARGYRVLALVPDVATMERESLGEDPEVELAARILGLERWAMLQRLHAAKVSSLLWDVRYPLTPQAKAAWRRAR